MSYYEPRPLRLMVAVEADALIAKFGGEAYAVACWRAEEASSETMETDWREVALMIARKDQKRVRPSPTTNLGLLGRSVALHLVDSAQLLPQARSNFRFKSRAGKKRDNLARSVGQAWQ